MQVKVIREPILPSNLYQRSDVLVLPIFVNEDVYSSVVFDCLHRRRVVFDYLKSHNVAFIGLPDNVAILFLCVEDKHHKKRILKYAKRLYQAGVSDDDYEEFDVTFPGLLNIFVTSVSDEPPSEYLLMPSTRSPIVIYSGDEALDRLFRTKVRAGEFAQYTPDSLAHPTMRSAFSRILRTFGKERGYDLEVVNLIRHKRKVFVTCDVMELELI